MEQKILVQFPGEEPYFLESKETPLEAALIIIKGHEKEIERLREALQKIADWPDYRLPSHQEIARAALKESE